MISLTLYHFQLLFQPYIPAKNITGYELGCKYRWLSYIGTFSGNIVFSLVWNIPCTWSHSQTESEIITKITMARDVRNNKRYNNDDANRWIKYEESLICDIRERMYILLQITYMFVHIQYLNSALSNVRIHLSVNRSKSSISKHTIIDRKY